jgi:hypothetical protein
VTASDGTYSGSATYIVNAALSLTPNDGPSRPTAPSPWPSATRRSTRTAPPMVLATSPTVRSPSRMRPQAPRP